MHRHSLRPVFATPAYSCKPGRSIPSAFRMADTPAGEFVRALIGDPKVMGQPRQKAKPLETRIGLEQVASISRSSTSSAVT